MASIPFLLMSHDVFNLKAIALVHACKFSGVSVKWDKIFSVSRVRRLTAITFLSSTQIAYHF